MKTLFITIALSLIALCEAAPVMAQQSVNFGNKDSFAEIAIYDSWEASPFTTGVLKGNWRIVSDPEEFTSDASNNQPKYVLGAQRSRFGSNLFGVKIDLPQSFELTPEGSNIRVRIHKPKNGRVALIGLGSRKERLEQNPFTEQFCVLSENTVEPDQWCEAVFPVRGANGVVIRSLVVVPDCESPHDLTEDFIFYISDININSSR